MNLSEYTEFLVKSIVKNPDMVKVTTFAGDEDTTLLEVMVPEADMGNVIGKSGKMIHSIRVMVQAYAYTHNLGKVNLNIDSF